MIHSRYRIVGRRRIGAASILSTTSAISIGMAALLAGSPAQAADECGPAVDGTVTCTAAGNPYADGITYAPANAFTLNTDADVAATGPVSVTGGDNVQINHNGAIATAGAGQTGLAVSGAGIGLALPGSITTSADTTDAVAVQATGDVNAQIDGTISASGLGSRAVTITGNNVTVGVTGTIATTGASGRDEFGNPQAPFPTALLVNAAGTAAITNSGTISTTGDMTPAMDISGATGVTINNTGAVSTGGQKATAIVLNSGAGIDGTIRNVRTIGSQSAAVTATAAGSVMLNVDGITTAQSDSDGLDVTTTAGDITVNAGTITTGNNGLSLENSGGAIIVNAQNVTSTNSGYGITAHSSAGPVAVNLVTGGASQYAFSGGVSAVSDTDAASVNIIKAETGTITVSGGTTAALTVANGATVATTSIALTAGTDATFDTAGSVGSIDSSASLTASGNTVTIRNSGSFIGSFNLSGQTNRFANTGTLSLDGQSAFSGSANTFTNTGTIKAFQVTSGGTQLARTINVAGNIALQNSGVVDLRNGVAGDVLTLGNAARNGASAGVGQFVGSGGSTLIVDTYQSGNASVSDKLIATGPITGSTQLIINRTSGAASLSPGLVFAQGGAGSSATAFTAASLPSGAGLVRYALRFDPTTNTYSLIGTPDNSLARTLKINEAAQQLWYRSADTVSSHFAEIRDARFGGYATGGGRVWGTMYGQTSNRRGGQDISAFGITTAADTAYKQNTFGGQLGFDAVGQAGRDGFTVGVTGGFQNSNVNFSGSRDSTRFRVANAGVLIGFQSGGLFANALGQFSYYWARARSSEAAFSDRFNGNSYGGQGELGYRFGTDRFYLEPVATIGYVRTNLNDLRINSDINVEFDTFQGLRGKAGARAGSRLDLGGGAVAIIYAQGNYVHEFKGKDGVSIIDVDTIATLRNRALPDYGEGKVGFSAGMANGVTGFVEGFGTVGHQYRGGGGRAGLRVKL